jgi:hypothetical protein
LVSSEHKIEQNRFPKKRKKNMDFEARTNAKLGKIKERIEIIEQLKNVGTLNKNIQTALDEIITRTQTLIVIMENPVRESWLVEPRS